MESDQSARIQKSLTSSRLPIWIVMVWFGLVGVLSLVAFLFQSQYQEPFGERFRDQPGAWWHLAGHFLRGIMGLILTINLWRLLNAIRRAKSAVDSTNLELVERLRSWWISLSICLIVLTGFTVLGLVRGDLVPLERARYSDSTLEKFSLPAKESSSPEPPVKVEFRLAEFEPADGLEKAEARDGQSTYLHPTAFMTNEDILETRVVQSADGDLRVDVTFTKTAAERMRQTSTAHRDRPIAILIDRKVLMAPVIRGPIGEKASLNGFATRSEAERIARGITAQR